jgi:hypothetical protein
MPKRHDMAEGDCIEVAGVPVSIGFARGKRAVVFVGGFDQDNLLEDFDLVKAAARRYRERIDKARPSGDTSN